MSWPTITFLDSAKSESVTVNRPGYGYVSEIHMPIVATRANDGTYGFYDPPDDDEPPNYGTYDYRIMRSSAWRMTDAQKTLFNIFMRDAAKGRAQDIYMRLSAVDDYTGFYPFCVDMFDNGDYKIRFVDRSQSGKQVRPWRWHEDEIEMVYISKDSTFFSAQIRSEGKLKIGDIGTRFMYPPNGIRPKSRYCHDTQLSISGVPNSINGPGAGDSWESKFDIICNTYNAYALIDQLVNTTRTDDIDLEVPDDFDMFGADQSPDGTGGIYTAKFLGSERTESEIILKTIHEGYDRFRIPLSFWMKEKQS